MHVLGLDAGGTKTVCLLADGDGRILRGVRAAGSNFHSAAIAEIEALLSEAIGQALDGVAEPPAAVCVGMAGADREEEIGAVRSILGRILPSSRALVVNDALIALTAGAGDGAGVVIVSGTGSIAYGRNGRNEAARAGGWGHLLGDEGSGYWMGRLALRAVVRQADGRGPVTALTGLILAHFDVAHPDQLIQEVHRASLPPAGIAALAEYVQRADEAGDAVAGAILANGATELALSGASVASRLDMLESAFPFVLAGSVFRAVPALANAVGARLREAAPRSHATVLAEEPAVGAVRLAITEASGRTAVPRYREGGSREDG